MCFAPSADTTKSISIGIEKSTGETCDFNERFILGCNKPQTKKVSMTFMRYKVIDIFLRSDCINRFGYFVNHKIQIVKEIKKY